MIPRKLKVQILVDVLRIWMSGRAYFQAYPGAHNTHENHIVDHAVICEREIDFYSVCLAKK